MAVEIPPYYLKVEIYADRVDTPNTTPAFNPTALSQVVKETLLPIHRGPSEFGIGDPFTVEIRVLKNEPTEPLPNALSALFSEGLEATGMGVAIFMAASDEQPDDDPTYKNPRLIYADRVGRFNLDTLVANYLLLHGVKQQADRMRTGFLIDDTLDCKSVCQLPECRKVCQKRWDPQQITVLSAHKFAAEKMERILNGEIEPIISL